METMITKLGRDNSVPDYFPKHPSEQDYDDREQCTECREWFDPDDLTMGVCDECIRDRCTMSAAYEAMDRLDGLNEYLDWCAELNIRVPELEDFLKYVFDERTDTSAYKETLCKIYAKR